MAGTLAGTMESMLAGGRRNLPPVPPPGRFGRATTGTGTPARQRWTADGSDDTSPVRPSAPARPDRDGARDAGQEFVARLRGAAAGFATAAGATSAVVREAVPPARHRRSRCRLVLRYPNGREVDLTFLGSADRPGAGAQHGFGEAIQRWLRTGQHRAQGWLVPDEDAADGTAVDVTAWLAAG